MYPSVYSSTGEVDILYEAEIIKIHEQFQVAFRQLFDKIAKIINRGTMHILSIENSCFLEYEGIVSFLLDRIIMCCKTTEKEDGCI